MLGRKPDAEETRLNEAIARVMDEMETVPPESDEYGILLSKLERLNALKPDKGKRTLSLDTLVTAGSWLAGVVVIVAYEQKHVFASKAISLFRSTPQT